MSFTLTVFEQNWHDRWVSSPKIDKKLRCCGDYEDIRNNPTLKKGLDLAINEIIDKNYDDYEID